MTVIDGSGSMSLLLAVPVLVLVLVLMVWRSRLQVRQELIRQAGTARILEAAVGHLLSTQDQNWAALLTATARQVLVASTAELLAVDGPEPLPTDAGMAGWIEARTMGVTIATASAGRAVLTVQRSSSQGPFGKADLVVLKLIAERASGWLRDAALMTTSPSNDLTRNPAPGRLSDALAELLGAEVPAVELVALGTWKLSPGGTRS